METLPVQAGSLRIGSGREITCRRGARLTNAVTLDVVAKMAGVSRATASRALNHKPGVADDVRDRVRIIAESLDYRPNRAAKTLGGGRSSVIGLVLGSQELVADMYAASLVQSMGRAAEHYDEGLMLLATSNEPGRVVKNMLRDGLIDGVVVSAVATGEDWIEELLDAKVPTVLLGSHPTRQDVNFIDVENRESSASLVGHMLDTGCSRVATITGVMSRVDAKLRLEGFRLAHERRGLEVDEALIVHGDFSRQTGYERASKLLAAKPDAIYAANDETAFGVMLAAKEHGLSIPQDLSLAGFDGTETTELAVPTLTTVMQPFDELALAAVRSLVSLLNKESIPREQFVEPQLRFGDTTREIRRNDNDLPGPKLHELHPNVGIRADIRPSGRSLRWK